MTPTTKTSQRTLFIGLGIAMLARILLDALFIGGVFPLRFHNGWMLYQGGDQEWLFTLAESFVAGRPQASPVGVGVSLLMAPFITLTGAQTVADIAMPVVIVQGFVMGTLSVGIIGLLTYNLGRDIRLSLAAAAIWALVPLFAYVGFFWHYEAHLMRSTTVPRMAWLNTLSDGPALFFILLGVLLASVQFRPVEMPWRFWALWGGGVALGITVLFRMHLMPAVLALIVLMMLVSGWRAVTIIGIGAFMGYMPQMVYHQLVYGRPFVVSYAAYARLGNNRYYGFQRTDVEASLESFAVLFRGLQSFEPSLPIVLLGGIAIGLVIGIFWWVARRYSWQAAYILVVIPTAYLIPVMLTDPFFLDPIRFSMPALPFAIIGGVLMVGALPLTIQTLSSRRPALRDGSHEGP